MLRPPSRDHVAAPKLRFPGASYPSPSGCATALSYFGGPIMASPVVVQVSWDNPTSSVASSVESYLGTWWPAILSSQANYLSLLEEYSTTGKVGTDGNPGSNQTFTGSGSYAGLYKITPSSANQGATVTDAAIGAELVAQIQAGNLPRPTFDASGNCNTIYMIDFPPNVTDIQLSFAGSVSDSCTAFCGYHAGVAWGSGQYLYYGVYPDMTAACTSCAPDGLNQDVAMVHSHELGEAMTDPEAFAEPLTSASTDFMRPGGWDQIASGCGEIGDSCAWPSAIPSVAVGGQSYYVQGLFDNARDDCETSPAATNCTTSATCTDPMRPACTAGTCQGCAVDADCAGNASGGACQPSGACGPCSATNQAACTGSTPACNTTTGVCVACASNAYCSGGTPICDVSTSTCRACQAVDCTGATPACATSGANAGRCVPCVSSTQCAAPRPYCDSATDTCVGCLTSSDCPASAPVCDSTSHSCRGCASSADCAGGTNRVCDVPTGACVACVQNTDCASGACDTTTHTCVQCVDDKECMNPMPVCNTATHTCEACGSSTQCAGNSQGSTCTSGSCTTGGAAADGGATGNDGGATTGDAGDGADGGGSGSNSDGGGSDGGGSVGGSGGAGSGGGCAMAPSGPPGATLPGLAALLGLVSVRRRRTARR